MNDLNKSKLSKLQARKLKQSYIAHDPLDFLQQQSVEVTHKTTISNENGISTGKDERKRWLTKLHEENQLLLQLLDDLQDSKREMCKRLQELELAKETIKSLKASISLDTIDKYILSECQLVANNRANLNFSIEKSELAEKVYERMIAVTSRFKTNYSSFQEFLLENLIEITRLLLDNQTQESEALLRTLENITIANPFNFEAVQYLNQSLEKAFFSATAFHFQHTLQKEISNRQSLILKSGKMVPDGELINQQIQDSVLKDHKEELRNVVQQNEALKQSVAQLREQLLQLRNNPSNRVEAFQNTKLFSDESASTLPSLLRDDTITLKGGDDNTVPKIVHLPLIERTKKYIMQCISGHPLSLQFSSVVLDYIKDEVINQLDPIICTTFQTYFAFRFLPQLPVELQNEYKLNGGKVFDESIFSKFPTVHKALAEIMDEIFQLSFVHAEIMSRITMYLTYMHTRLR